jgi:hypothetical protein
VLVDEHLSPFERRARATARPEPTQISQKLVEPHASRAWPYAPNDVVVHDVPMVLPVRVMWGAASSGTLTGEEL